jgi:hypothetical protein
MKKIETIYNIDSFKKLKIITKKEAEEKAFLTKEKGGFSLKVVNCAPYYGIIGLVFYEEKQIKQELLQEEPSFYEIGKYFINLFNKEYYTEAELEEPLKDYEDYRRRSNFLNNMEPEKYDNINIFQKDFDEKARQYPFTDIVGIYYFNNKKIADGITKKWEKLDAENKRRMKDDNDYFKSAVIYELANFEVCVSGDPTDALIQLGINPKFLNKDQLGLLNQQLQKYHCEAF